MGGKDDNDALAMLGAMVGKKNETVDDVVQSMLDYAKAMQRRHKEAVDGDKSLPCNVVALRMEDTASRVKAALRRERARWRAKVRKAGGDMIQIVMKPVPGEGAVNEETLCISERGAKNECRR